jgi:hypothetical protein
MKKIEKSGKKRWKLQLECNTPEIKFGFGNKD